MHLSRRTLLGLVPPTVIGSVLARGPVPRLSFALGTAGDDAVILAVLDLVPASARKDDERHGIVVELTDIARELDHAEIERPASLDEDGPAREAFLDQLIAVSLTGGTVVQFAMTPGWSDLHGFDILDVDQIAMYGQPPDRVTVLQGRFDLDGIRTALMGQAYETVEVDGVTVMTLGESDDLGLDNPVNQLWVGGARNVALIDDAHLVFSASMALIAAVIRTAAGAGDSLMSDDDMLALFPATAEAFTSGAIVDGRGLAADRFPEQGGDDVSLLPRVELVAFGLTPGGIVEPSSGSDEPAVGYPVGENQIRVLFADGAAAVAGRKAIEARLAAGSSVRIEETWSDLYGEVVVEQVDDTALVIVHLPDWIPGQRRATDLLYMGDMGFLLWE